MRLTLLLFGLWSALAGAESQEDSGFYETPLEQLLDIQVSTASKQVEAFEHTAAVVEVLTQKDFHAFGAVTLAELLERMTSLYMSGTLPFPQGMLSIRGDVTAEQNNHVLILLNGRPMRDSVYSGLNQDLYTAFPLQAIKQIEVVRGPGSVLYGTNAFVGVINLITRDDTAPRFETAVRYGAFDAKQVETYFSGNLGEIGITGGASVFHNRGWNFTAADWDRSNSTSLQKSIFQYTRTASGVVTGRWKKLTVQAYGDVSEVPFMSSDSSNPTWRYGGNERISRLATDLGYDFGVAQDWRATVNATYNHLAATSGTTALTNAAKSDDLLLEWTNYLTLSPAWNALLGATYAKQTGIAVNLESNARQIPYYNEDVFSLYGQTGYQLLDSLKILGGGQVIKFSGNDVSVVPRAAVTYVLSPQVGFKALYSKAFRAPAQSERNLIPVDPTRVLTRGNPALTPETVSTIDLQGYYHARAFQASATLFYSRQINLIQPFLTAGLPVYANAGNQTFKGVELEGKWIPHPQWTLQANMTAQGARSDTAAQDDIYVPSFMAKWGAAYQTEAGFEFGLFHAFLNQAKKVDNGDGSTHDVNPALKYYNSVSLKAAAKLNRVLGLAAFPETELELYGTNLLDESIYYPEFVYGVINSFPGRAGRAVYGRLVMKF